MLGRTPLRAALLAAGVSPGALPRDRTADEYVAGVAALPLAFQPGEGWLYDTGIDLLGVLLARATGRPVSALVADRVTGPLGMTDTAFGAVDPARLPPAYRPEGDGLALLDPADGAYARPPRHEQLAVGLVASAPDVLRFFTAMADGEVLDPDSLALMTTDAVPPALHPQVQLITGPGRSWGLATAVDVGTELPWLAPGRWGWNGGTGTTANVDPSRETVAVLLTQRAFAGPLDGFDAFWTAVAKV